jgi:hypothetical protein
LRVKGYHGLEKQGLAMREKNVERRPPFWESDHLLVESPVKKAFLSIIQVDSEQRTASGSPYNSTVRRGCG